LEELDHAHRFPCVTAETVELVNQKVIDGPVVFGYKLSQLDKIGAVKCPCALAPVDKGINQFDIVEFQPLIGIELLSFDGTVTLSDLAEP
jgi:hypothetical protein